MPDKESKKTNSGIKKHAGHYDDAVIAEARDQEQRNPSQRPQTPSQDVGVGERVSDGRRESYTGNTASELNREGPDRQTKESKH